ncbi:MAG: hypothetical protein ACK4OF_08005 [Aquificaceae bacterium]
MKRLILLLFIGIAFAKEVPFTQEDRERLIRLEVKVEGLQRQIDDLRATTQKQIDDLKLSNQKQIEGLQRQMDDLKTFMLWGFGILFGDMGILTGLVMWDRRTTMSPMVKKTREVEDKSERIEKAIKEVAKRNPEIEETLKRVGLL